MSKPDVFLKLPSFEGLRISPKPPAGFRGNWNLSTIRNHVACITQDIVKWLPVVDVVVVVAFFFLFSY